MVPMEKVGVIPIPLERPDVWYITVRCVCSRSAASTHVATVGSTNQDRPASPVLQIHVPKRNVAIRRNQHHDQHHDHCRTQNRFLGAYQAPETRIELRIDGPFVVPTHSRFTALPVHWKLATWTSSPDNLSTYRTKHKHIIRKLLSVNLDLVSFGWHDFKVGNS